jgi:hypothetical protein
MTKDVEMMTNSRGRVPWFLWPFAAVWDLVAFILGLTGRLVAGVLGLALLIVGGVLTLLVITAWLGIPLAIFGFLLMVRSIF